MRYFIVLVIAISGCCFSARSWADGNCGEGSTEVKFMRADMVTLKAHMAKVLAAIGSLPAPYARINDDWQLPASACRDKNGFVPIAVRYSGTFSAEQNQDAIQAAYQKKMAAAEASGNYAAMATLAQQMQAAVIAASASSQAATPVDITIVANGFEQGTIDPDSVLRDGPGFLALRQQGGNADNETVTVYFDKVQLKNAHQLASFNFGRWLVPAKLSLISMTIQIQGAKANVERLVKQIDAQAVLSQLSAERTPSGALAFGC